MSYSKKEKIDEEKDDRKLLCPLLKKPCKLKDKLSPNYSINYINNTKFTFQTSCEDLIKIDKFNNENILKEVKNKDTKSKKSKKKLNLLYYLLNFVAIGIVLAVQLSKQNNPEESMSAILDINWWFILAAFGLFLAGMFLEQIRYSVLIHKATGVFRFGLSYKIAALGRYYDTITPLGTGGQPFQVVYLNKYGIKPGEGISITMGKYIFFEIVYFFLVSFFVFRAVFNGDSGTALTANVGEGVVTTFMWIGYAILACLIVFMLLVSLNRRFGAGFIVGVLKLLNKIHIGKFRIIKDYKKSFNNVMRTVNVWQNTTRKYSKSFWVIFVNVVGSFIFFFVNYSVPYFVFCAFVGWSPEHWLTIISMTVMIDLTSAFNPIPMGTGTADLSFSVLYTALFVEVLGSTIGTGASIWALIIWRALSCYIYIFQGLIVVNYDYFVGNKRLEKYKDFWMLPIKERIKIKLKRKK